MIIIFKLLKILKMDWNGNIYLIYPNEYRIKNLQIFKVGRSEQADCRRLSGYDQGYKVLFWNSCLCDKKLERIIIQLFKLKYSQRKDIGTEYFEGDWRLMIQDIMLILLKEIKCNLEIEKIFPKFNKFSIDYTSDSSFNEDDLEDEDGEEDEEDEKDIDGNVKEKISYKNCSIYKLSIDNFEKFVISGTKRPYLASVLASHKDDYKKWVNAGKPEKKYRSYYPLFEKSKNLSEIKITLLEKHENLKDKNELNQKIKLAEEKYKENLYLE